MKRPLEIIPFYTYAPQMTIIWCTRFLRYGAQQTEFFVILGLFLPIYPTNNLRKQKFEKRKKKPGDIIILHLRTANDNHMIYGSWDMERNRQNFFSLWTTFCPFTPWHPENQNFDKMKKRPEDIIILQRCTIN